MTNRHCHADMIIAKAENMDLVVFVKSLGGVEWCELPNDDSPNFHGSSKYFLCLPQHKEVCLRVLNGLRGEYRFSSESETWTAFTGGCEWLSSSLFMRSGCEIRIKPRKEKRWIAIRKKDSCVSNGLFDSESEVIEYCPSDIYSHHEIEVEV